METKNQISTRIQTLIPMVHHEVKSYHYTTITRAGFWRGHGASVCMYMCVCVCGLTGAHILPGQQHGHLGDTHSFLNYLPAFFQPFPHHSSFIPSNSEAAGGYDVCCVIRIRHSSSSSIFSSWWHSSVQKASYIYRRWFELSKPRLFTQDIWRGGWRNPSLLCFLFINE